LQLRVTATNDRAVGDIEILEIDASKREDSRAARSIGRNFNASIIVARPGEDKSSGVRVFSQPGPARAG
jgi:hypothetical protein